MSGPTQAMPGTEGRVAVLAEPAPRAHSKPDTSDPANDWLCAACCHRVASEKDRLSLDGKSEFTFKNPEGTRFVIYTFSRTLGCVEVGTPTLQHTWFPGHAWSFCMCARCRLQLGWYYTGPTTFVGLIRDRILRAAVAWN